jgi:hypothetical protein
MNDAYTTIAKRLTQSGFRETEPGCFTSPTGPRVIGLAVCPANPETWPQKVEHLLRRETIRLALSWARYVILLVDGPKTPPLAWSAAAFAQDVSKCRRIVLFFDQANGAEPTLPFVGLPQLIAGVDAPARDVEAIVRKELPGKIADAFLNEDLPNTHVQELAEETDS